MRVLLAGASGDIGRHLIPALVAAGHEVVGITREPGALARFQATELVADLGNRRGFLARLEGESFDAVIHEATALRRVPVRYSDMRDTNRLRLEGTSTLIAAARLTGATKLVAASVAYGYGFADHDAQPLVESDAFAEPTHDRLDPILAALLSLEQQVRAFGGVALRYGIFYPTHGSPAPVASDSHGLLPFIHPADAAAATVLALEHGTPGAVYNIVDDTPATWRDLQQARAVVAGRSLVALPTWLLQLVAPFSSQLIARTSMVVSNERAKAELGWSPRYPSFADGLAPALTVVHADHPTVAEVSEVVTEEPAGAPASEPQENPAAGPLDAPTDEASKDETPEFHESPADQPGEDLLEPVEAATEPEPAPTPAPRKRTPAKPRTTPSRKPAAQKPEPLEPTEPADPAPSTIPEPVEGASAEEPATTPKPRTPAKPRTPRTTSTIKPRTPAAKKPAAQATGAEATGANASAAEATAAEATTGEATTAATPKPRTPAKPRTAGTRTTARTTAPRTPAAKIEKPSQL